MEFAGFLLLPEDQTVTAWTVVEESGLDLKSAVQAARDEQEETQFFLLKDCQDEEE